MKTFTLANTPNRSLNFHPQDKNRKKNPTVLGLVQPCCRKQRLRTNAAEMNAEQRVLLQWGHNKGHKATENMLCYFSSI